MITYNHERFIRQAIQGVMDQTVDFDVELVIGDDCSKDGSRTIIDEFAARFATRIRVLPRSVNLGAGKNFVDVLQHCRGEYIAVLEGDDYWSSHLKLAKQVAVLEQCSEHVICFHPAYYLVDGENRPPGGRYGPVDSRSTYTLDDLLEHGNFIPTASLVFRSNRIQHLPAWYSSLPIGDWSLNVLLSMHGTIGFIDETMAVYRQHANGAYSGASAIRKLLSLQKMFESLGQISELSKRRSFQVALANHRLSLCWAYRSERHTKLAATFLYRSLRVAPGRHKAKIFGEFIRLSRKRLSGKLLAKPPANV